MFPCAQACCVCVFVSNEAVFVSIKREGCIKMYGNTSVWVTYNEGWNSVQDRAWCTLWDSFTRIHTYSTKKNRQSVHPSILINWEKQCKPNSSHVLKKPLFLFNFFFFPHNPAPVHWREVTICKSTLSSALDFLLFLFPAISCVWEHTPAASL